MPSLDFRRPPVESQGLISERIDIVSVGYGGPSELAIGEIKKGHPIVPSMGMVTFPEPDSEFVFNAEKTIDFPGGEMGFSGAGWVGPEIAQRFASQQGAWGDEGLEKMLVEGQVGFTSDKLLEPGAEPVIDDAGQILDGFGFRSLKSKTTGAAGAGIVGAGGSDAGIGGSGEKGCFSPA